MRKFIAYSIVKNKSQYKTDSRVVQKIVADNDKAILIDTGRKKYCEKILERCKKFHVSLIVFTHGHMDHCQNAAYLAEALHIPIAINKNDMDLITDNRKQSLLAKTLLGKIVLSVSLSSFEMDSLEVFDPIIYLKNGDDLSEYGIACRICLEANKCTDWGGYISVTKYTTRRDESNVAGTGGDC